MRPASLRRALLAAPLALLAACATQVNEPARPVDVPAADAPDASAPDVADDALQPPPDNAPPEDLPAPLDTPPTDVGGCSMGLAECGGSCRDLQTDPMHCGVCGNVCARGQVCSGGACACPSGQMPCGAACAVVGSDPANCGMCGRACPSGQACSSGACMLTCATGTTACNGACRDLTSDRDHCGACGTPCPAGHTCASGVCRVGAVRGPEFRVNWLGATNCRSAEHVSVTGADRGGIALSNAQLFYTGQTATGRFNLATLDGAAVGARYDAIVSNLRTAVVYVFVDASGNPIAAPTGTAVALRELDSSTGALTAQRVMLSSPITLNGMAASSVGFFSGWDRAYVLTGGRAFNIDLPTGAVLDLGTTELPARSTCPGWAFWGVAELASGIPSIVYVSDPTTISRRPLPAGPVTPVSQFMSLSNMCSFTVAPAAQRWYFHHSRASQLGGGGGAAETVGFCDASTSIAGPTCPAGVASCGGVCRNLMTDPNNCGACNTSCGAGGVCAGGRCASAPRRYTRSTPPVTVSYLDACTTPGHATLLPTIDDSTAAVMMPFDYRFWGDAVPMGAPLTVSSNGYLLFGTATTTPTAGSIPSTFSPNGIVAAQWVDLVTRTDGVCAAVDGAAPARRYVVQWSNVRNIGGGSTNVLNFEVALNERDASIDLLYATMTGAVAATVGVENPTGSEAIGGCAAGPTVTSCVVTANARMRFDPSM